VKRSIPDILVIVDDDTSVDLNKVKQFMMTKESSSSREEPYIAAGSVFQLGKYGGFKAAHGGFGTYLNKAAIELMTRRPIFCNKDDNGFIPTALEGDEDPFTMNACKQLAQNKAQELDVYTPGDSVFNIFYKLASRPYFCMHSDWMIGFMITNYVMTKDGLVQVDPQGKRGYCGEESVSCHYQTPALMEQFVQMHPQQPQPPLLLSPLSSVSSGTEVEQPLAIYKECIRHTTHELLPAIIAKINEDPEDNGLKPFILSSQDKRTNDVKGLDLNIVRGKRIAILGDSTLFYLTQWLYSMMTHLKDEENGQPKYDEMPLSEASTVVQERADMLGVQLPDNRQESLPITDYDGTLIQWTGMKGLTRAESLEGKISRMFETARQMNPRVIVANMGLYWLHLRPFTGPSNGIVIHRWAHYKDDWLTQVYNLALDMNETTLLLFKTTNFVCDIKRTNDWETYANLYLSMDNQTVEACYQENKQFIGTYELTQSQVYDYCQYGQFTEIGVQHYNQFIHEFVREIHEKQTNSRLTVGIFNDHDVLSCDSTDDAIHHYKNMEVRLRLLSNTIDSYLGCRNYPQSVMEMTPEQLVTTLEEKTISYNPLHICDRPTNHIRMQHPNVNQPCPSTSQDKPLLLLEGSIARGRTGNNFMELLHAIQLTKDQDIQLGMMKQSWAMKLVTNLWFETNENTNTFDYEILERTLCIRIFDTPEEVEGWNVVHMTTQELFVYHSPLSVPDYMTSQLEIFRRLFQSILYAGQGINLGSISTRSTRDMCSGINELFPTLEERSSAIYTVIHSRHRGYKKVSKKTGCDLTAALEMQPEYIKSLLQPLGMLEYPIVLITDGEDPKVLERLATDPDIGRHLRLLDKSSSTLGGEMTLAMMSQVFIGNPGSSLSAFIAKARSSFGFEHNKMFMAKDTTTGQWQSVCDDQCLFDYDIMGDQA